MRKHCEQLHLRLIQWEQEQRRKEMVEGKGSRTTTPCGSPDLPKRKGRQHLLDPIRRWNSFHNSRDRRPQRQALPYLQTLEQFRKNQEAKSSEVFASMCADIPSRDYGHSYMPMLPQGSESLEKASRVLGTNIAHELIALSLANLKEAAKSPTRKQFSSPNLIDPMKNSPRCRRTSSDSCQVDYSGGRFTTPNQITKTLSTSNPEDLPNQKTPIPKLSINESPQTESSTSGIESYRKTSCSSTFSSCSSKTVPRVVALRTESVSELLAASPLSSSLPSDVGLLPPSAPQLPRRRFSVW